MSNIPWSAVKFELPDVRSFLFRVLLCLLVAFSVAGCGSRGDRLSADGTCHFWVDADDRPAISAMINDVPIEALIDTGYNCGVCLPREDLPLYKMKEKGKDKVPNTFPSGNEESWLTDSFILSIGRKKINVNAASATEKLILNIFGMQVLNALGAIIDCGKQSLSYPSIIDGTSRGDYYTRENFLSLGFRPFRWAGQSEILINGSLDGHRVFFLVDTGSTISSLSARLIQQWGMSDEGTWFHFSRFISRSLGFYNVYDGAGNALRYGRSRPMALSMGDISIVNQYQTWDMQAINEHRSRDGEPPMAGIIGMDILLRCQAVIDFRNKTMYLKPP